MFWRGGGSGRGEGGGLGGGLNAQNELSGGEFRVFLGGPDYRACKNLVFWSKID